MNIDDLLTAIKDFDTKKSELKQIIRNIFNNEDIKFKEKKQLYDLCKDEFLDIEEYIYNYNSDMFKGSSFQDLKITKWLDELYDDIDRHSIIHFDDYYLGNLMDSLIDFLYDNKMLTQEEYDEGICLRAEEYYDELKVILYKCWMKDFVYAFHFDW